MGQWANSLSVERRKLLILDPEDEHYRDMTTMGPPDRPYGSVNIDGKREMLHRIIAGASRGEVVDHRDGNILDNRKANLRNTSVRVNAWNSPVSRGISGRRGVHLNKKTGKYYAQLRANGRRYSGSLRDTAQEAEKDYVALELKHHGVQPRRAEAVEAVL